MNHPTSITGSFFGFIEDCATQLLSSGKVRTAQTYLSALSSFRLFRNGTDIPPTLIDGFLIYQYEQWLEQNGNVPNTISFYMRILRANYNRAVRQGLSVQRFPFRDVYTGIAKTVKRGLSINQIQDIAALPLRAGSAKAIARDVFMFSFYTRGMSFIDIAFLTKSNIQGNSIVYRRHKTGKRLYIRLEPPIRQLLRQYASPSEYLMPILQKIDKPENLHHEYMLAMQRINRTLKAVAEKAEIASPLTMHTARHSWASIARSCNISLTTICEALGHENEKTTLIYLNSLDNDAVNLANNHIISMIKPRK